MTDSTPDWDRWRDLWLAPRVSPDTLLEELRLRLARHRRHAALAIAGDMLITVIALGIIALRVRAQPDAATLLWASGSLAFIGVVWRFAIRSRKELLAPVAEHAGAYLAAHQRRIARELRTVRFAAMATALQAAVTAAWLVWRFGVRPAAWPQSAVAAWFLLALLVVIIASWCGWQSRRSVRERDALNRLVRELEPEPAPVQR